MFLNKKTYEDLVAKVEKLAKENKELKSKYEGKINSELNLKEYKKAVDKKAKDEIEAYKKNLNALAEKDFNYAFLQQLVNASAKGTVIEVTLKSGNSITIRKEEKADKSDIDLYSIL